MHYWPFVKLRIISELLKVLFVCFCFNVSYGNTGYTIAEVPVSI